MDKYEFNIKVEQIKKLAAKKSYKEAAAIAKDMNWQKVKDWSLLATVINVQEAAGDYVEARDMAILAYNRNLGGRKLVYKLTELMIKLEDFENAEDLYEEYEKMSQHDVNRYILYYDLRKAQKASDNELVEILEDYKEHEIDEKYMFELASLYSKTGRNDECVKTCDDIVLWFQDGIYVERALKLKQELGAALTSSQKKISEDLKNKKQDIEATKEILFEEQKRLAAIQKDDIEEAFAEDELDMDSLSEDDDEGGISSFFKKTFGGHKPADKKPVYKEEEFDDTEEEPEDLSKTRPVVLDLSDKKSVKPEEAKVSDTSLKSSDLSSSIDRVSVSLKEMVEDAKKKLEDDYQELNKEDSPKQKQTKKKDRSAQRKKAAEARKNTDEAKSVSEEDKVMSDKTEVKEDIFETEAFLSEPIDDIKKNLIGEPQKEEEQSIIEKAVKALDAQGKPAQDNKRVSAKEAAPLAETTDIGDIQVDIPNFDNPYNTQNLQAAIAENLSAFLEQEKEEAESLRPQPIQVQPDTSNEPEAEYEEQIEGQLSLADWLETVREEKYGKQNTREFSKTELERMLDEKDEKSAAYEKLISEQKAQAERTGRNFDEEEADRKAKAQMMVQAARTDLAIRTGKATAHLESEAMQISSQSKQEVKHKDLSNTAAFKVIAPEQAAPSEKPQAQLEQVSLQTAPLQRVTDEILNSVNQIMAENESEKDVNPLEAISSANLANAVYQDETAATVTPHSEEFEEAEDGDKKLTGELAKIFRKYREMPGLESQLADYFAALQTEMQMTTSEVGNIIISGNSSSDKSDLARTIVRAINYLYPDRTRKIAKTTGDSINHRGLTKAMNKLRGTALLVEGAGTIQPKRMAEVLSCLEQDTDRMIVILEDSDAEMNVLLNFNPDMAKKFNHRIVLKQYTVNELVEMARKFARKRQYEVDDDALLELYLKIDKLRSNIDNIRLDDVKEIINEAIARSEKRASRKFFGGLKKKRGENGDIIFLSEADFKD